MEQSELQSGSYEMIDQNQVILSTAVDADLELWQYAEEHAPFRASLYYFMLRCVAYLVLDFVLAKLLY